MDHLLGRTEVFAVQKDKSESSVDLPFLDSNQRMALSQLSRLPAFNSIIATVKGSSSFVDWLGLDDPELSVPVLWSNDEKLSKFLIKCVSLIYCFCYVKFLFFFFNSIF